MNPYCAISSVYTIEHYDNCKNVDLVDSMFYSGDHRRIYSYITQWKTERTNETWTKMSLNALLPNNNYRCLYHTKPYEIITNDFFRLRIQKFVE